MDYFDIVFVFVTVFIMCALTLEGWRSKGKPRVKR